jgi:pseudouridylate synthase
MIELFSFSDEVKQAKKEGRAVVALESTIISHGMPYPQNLETALCVESLVRNEGAVPATIALIDGRVVIGVNGEQLERLASEKIVKVSRRDIPLVLSKKGSGATTVATAMFFAHHAGIRVFATGGIGGVHRGVAQTWDISADLNEFALSDVAVVSAGVKSILDVPKTMEVLETLGVPIIGYRTEEFPSFFSRESGCKVDICLDSPSAIADVLEKKKMFGLKGGALIANPIPLEHALEREIVEQWIKDALQEADRIGIRGKEITPFLLKTIAQQSNGRTLAANIALIQNNAVLAAQIALELEKLKEDVAEIPLAKAQILPERLEILEG